MKIVINGAGIAGQTLAYWLLYYGFEPTLVERAPRPRSGGYVVDFWGRGFDVAERMGLVPKLMSEGYVLEEVRLVDCQGKRCGGFSAKGLHRAMDGRYVSLPRGALATALHDEIAGRVKTVFADSIAGLAQDESGVRVEFERAPAETFDLAVGADGLHSRVRGLIFGGQERFERYLGYKVAAFEVGGYRPRDELVYVNYNRPGEHVARFALRDDRTMFLFVFCDDRPDPPDPGDLGAQKDFLHAKFNDAGWECPQILEAMASCDDIYFDRVSQIRMGRWTQGRLALVGDAAFCPSLLAGEGTALAMTAAYVLAGELYRASGNHRAAFARYEGFLKSFIARKQKMAEGFARIFVPSTALGVFFRNWMSKSVSIPFLAEFLFRHSFSDRIALPDYSLPRTTRVPQRTAEASTPTASVT